MRRARAILAPKRLTIGSLAFRFDRVFEGVRPPVC
jgi:hypothetical protein